MNRPRHLPTVAVAHPSCPATVLLSAPSAHPSTMRERSANICDDFALRDQRVNRSRSASVNTNSAWGVQNEAYPSVRLIPLNSGATHSFETQLRPAAPDSCVPTWFTSPSVGVDSHAATAHQPAESPNTDDSTDSQRLDPGRSPAPEPSEEATTMQTA